MGKLIKHATLIVGLIVLSGTLSAMTYRAALSKRYIWKKRDINVCWENPESVNSQDRQWVEDSISKTWSLYSALSFNGWRPCQSNSKGIRIRISDTGPHTKGLGKQLDGKKNGMVLNFTYRNWGHSCRYKKEYCTRVIAIHEFGHALSFAHEQNRGDTPDWCNEPQGSVGDINIGAWDIHSVMNYCNPKWSNHGILSSTDIEALQQFYGTPEEKKEFRVELKTNTGRKNVTFFRGENVEFFIKMSQPGYFFLIGESKNNQKSITYLFDFSAIAGEPKFVWKVEEKDADKWINIGKFVVSEPYGFETIKVISSSEAFTILPETFYDKEHGYYVLRDRTNSSIRDNNKSRRYIRKEAKLAETVLMIETKSYR